MDDKFFDGFSRLANVDIGTCIANKLSGAECWVWLYLVAHHPFADYTSDGEPIYTKLPCPADIAVAIGIHQKTVEAAMRKLRELGLYEYRITEWRGFNSTAAHAKEAARQVSRKSRLNHSQDKSQTPQTLTQQGLEGFDSFEEQIDSFEEQIDSSKEEFRSRRKAKVFTGQGIENRLQTIHTKQTLPPTPQGGKEREDGIDLIEVEVVNPSTSPLSTQKGSSSQVIDPNEDKCTPACSMVVAENTTRQSSTAISTVDPFYKNKGRSPQYITDNLPDGPWKTEKGRFDPAFIEWMANKWVNKYGGTIEDKKSDVWLHFRNKPDAIAVHWESYYEATQKAVENVKTRLEHGFDIESREQQKVVQNLRVLMNPLPEDLNPVDRSVQTLTPVIEPQPEPKPLPSAQHEQPTKPLLNRQEQGSIRPNDETPWMDNGVVHKGFFGWLVQEFGGSGAAQSRAFSFIRHESAEFVRPYWERFMGQDVEPVKESVKPVITDLNEAIANVGTRIERTHIEPEAELEQLQRALNDPILHRQTLALFRTPGRISETYECDFDGTQWLVYSA